MRFLFFQVLVLFMAIQAAAQSPLDRLDPDRYGPGTLIAAMEELAGYCPSQAVGPVRALMSHSDPDVARTAGWLLRRMGNGDDSAGVAGGVLGDPEVYEPFARASAALALGELRSANGAGALRAALADDPDPNVRARAADSLGRLHRPESAQALAGALASDESAQVRRAAARAMAAIPDADADALVSALDDPDAFVRLEATWALGRLRVLSASGNLIGSLQSDADCRVRAAAAWALGELGDSNATEALTQARESDCRLAAQAASAALRRFE